VTAEQVASAFANPTSTYKYLSTDLVSGTIRADWLPLTPQSFARSINGTAQFQGALNLTAGTAAEQATWLAGIENRRSVMWIFLNGVPVWNGIVWDWQPESILDGQMPFIASTMDSLFSHRVISEDLTFTSMDIFDIFRSLASYALAKTPNGAVSGLNLGTVESGVTATLSYSGSDLQLVSDAWTDLISLYGFEYAFRPGFGPNNTLVTYLDLGYPELGLQFPQSGLSYNMPGNLLDYIWTRTGSSSANCVIATASDDSGDDNTYVSAYPSGFDLADLAAGYPLLEESISLTTVDVTAQSQINAYATGVLPTVTGTQLTPILELANEQAPDVAEITLGSWCQVALTSPLHPAGPSGEPGYQGTGRIISWTVYPPTETQSEYTQLQLWIPVQ
jgi:hypothetical protein